MGMFDTVVIEGLKLPKLPKEVSSYLKNNNSSVPSEYQTKDLDNLMSTFIINEKGQIYVNEFKATGKKIPYVSPFSNWKDNRSLLERLYFKVIEKRLNKKFPDLKEIDERKAVKVKSKLTNTFQIYSYDEIGGRYVDLEFTVVAIEGKVKKITLIKASIEPEKDAKARRLTNQEFEKKFAEKIENKKLFKSKWYYPFLKETYNPFVFFTTKILQWGCNSILKITYRWHGI